MLEIHTPALARVVGVPIRRLAFPRGALLAAIIKGDRVVIPHGEDVIEAGDLAVVLCVPGSRAGVARMFKERSL